LRNDLWAGAKVIYDDKAKAVELLRYGLFWRTRPQFLWAFEYNRVGDKSNFQSSLYHKVSKTTKIGSVFKYDIDFKRFHSHTSVQTKVTDDTIFKVKAGHHGDIDTSLTARLAPYLKSTVSVGGNASNFFQGKTNDSAYLGIAFNFNL
jgi:hypothetical protein